MSKQLINSADYISAMTNLLEKLLPIHHDFDCIVALKRSGWILGAYLSNQLGKPVFSSTEIDTIPDKFKSVLVVDDKICTGKSMQKIINKLTRKQKTIHTAALFIQNQVFPEFVVKNMFGHTVQMWYENKNSNMEVSHAQ